jgi:hypothetical protein
MRLDPAQEAYLFRKMRQREKKQQGQGERNL